jgi:very-short-patch-repair endonuclease
MIKKYGDIVGVEKYNAYCEKQKDAGCSLPYFQSIYGDDIGLEKYNELNMKKSHSLESYINRYGDEELAKIKLEQFYENKNYGYASKVSQELFSEVCIKLGYSDGIYYRDLNKEFGKMNKDGRYFFYDFVDTKSKTVIEFNGLCFHVKNENENFRQLFSGKSKEYVIEHDTTKQRLIESVGYYVHYVWEDDFENDKNKIIEECVELIRNRNDNN